MGGFLNFAEHLAITCWLGSIVFLSFFVVPTLGGKLVEALFPRYYLLGVVCGVVLALVQVMRGVLWYWGGMIKPSIALFVLMTLISAYGLRRKSAVLNGGVLVLGLLYLAWMSMRGY